MAIVLANEPLIDASLSAITEVVVGVGVYVYIRKHVDHVSDITTGRSFKL